jgi:ABC-type dipeptide/oligopeptide/nickel transport system permease component
MRYDYEDPRPRRVRRKRGLTGLAVIVGLILVTAVGVAVYVLLNRLSDEVLAVLATVGCAAGVSLPTLVVAGIVLLRRAENGAGKQAAQQYTTTPPQIMVMPPMQLPNYPAAQQQTPATWERRSRPRHYVVMGDDD